MYCRHNLVNTHNSEGITQFNSLLNHHSLHNQTLPQKNQQSIQTAPKHLPTVHFRFLGPPKQEMSACSKIRHIVRLRTMLKRWRQKAASRIPSDVPSGHVAVTVGASCRRFVVPAKYLNHAVFRDLLVRAEEEYGFSNTGPLAIPCDELVFEEIIKCLSWPDSKNPTRFAKIEENCHVDVRNNAEFWPESRPLLNGVTEKSIW